MSRAAARHAEGLDSFRDNPGFQRTFIEHDGSAFDEVRGQLDEILDRQRTLRSSSRGAMLLRRMIQQFGQAIRRIDFDVLRVRPTVGKSTQLWMLLRAAIGWL